MRQKLFGWADEGAGAEGGSRLLCMREKEFSWECRREPRMGAVSITGDRAGGDGDGEVEGDEGEDGEEIRGLDVRSQIDWWTARSEVEHQSIHTSESTFR